MGIRAEKVAHHLGDRDDVARVDFRLILLGAPRPHRALDAGATFQRFQRAPDQRRLGELTHADGSDLRRRHPQRHLVLDEVDDEELELGARHLLLLDRQNLAHAMGRIDDELVGPEALTLGRLLAGHSGGNSFVRLAPDRCLGHGTPSARRRTGSCPPADAGWALFGPSAHDGGSLRPMARFSCHGFCVGLTSLVEVPRKRPEK